LIRKNKFVKSAVTALTSKSRTPRERMGDLKAQTAGNFTGERRVLEIVKKHGWKLFQRGCAESLRKTEQLMRLRLSKIPSGTYQAQDYLEDPDGHDIGLQVTLTLSKGRLKVDYTGTDRQVSNPLNAVYGVTLSGVYYVARTLTGDDVPANHGAFTPITVHAPEGTILNPTLPHPVAGGNVETSQRNADLLYRAFSKAIPDKVPADSGGSMNNIMMGGTYKGRNWAFYETIGVGLGARNDADGIDGMQANMTNTMNTPIEEIERSYPLLIKQYELRSDSSGPGHKRGGSGIIRSYQALADDITVTVLADRGRNEPQGVVGGGPGERTEVTVYKKAKGKTRKIRLSVKITVVLQKGDIIEIKTAGGGGYGKAETREKSRTRDDIENEIISYPYARRAHYRISSGT
jgi:N-methylhydantoinase B